MFDNDYIPGFRKIGKSDNWILYEFDDEPSKSFILVKEPRFYYMYVNKKTMETIPCTIPYPDSDLPEEEYRTFMYLVPLEEID